MKLVSYNIQYGFGIDGRYDLERIARVVADADIIALQEVERFWKRSNEDDQPEILSRLLPDHYWVYGPAFDMDASFRNADGRIVNRRRQFGTMLLSRLPIAWSRLHLLPMRRVVNPLNTQNAALECLIRTPSGPIRILSLHLSPHRRRASGWNRSTICFPAIAAFRSRAARGAASMTNRTAAGRTARRSPSARWPRSGWATSTSEPGSAEYSRIAGGHPYHPASRLFRRVHRRGGGRRPSRPMPSTPMSSKSAAGRRKRQLDHCFVGSMLASRVKSVRVDNQEIASDHHPLFVDIDLETPDGAKTARW